MKVINFILDNWYLLLVLLFCVVVAVLTIKKFLQQPQDKQIAKVQEWLLYAVAQAEKEFGSGTGQLKLRFVYDSFVARFPQVAAMITFETFSTMVDIALSKFNNMLTSNKKVQSYVNQEQV